MFKIILIWLLLIVSIAFPPLLVVSIPVVLWYSRRIARRVRFLRASREAYLDETAIRTAAKGLR